MKRAWVALFLLLPAIVFAQGGIRDKTESLEEYQRKIKDQKERLRKLAGREGSLLKELDRLSHRAEQLETRIRRLEREQQEVDGRISKAAKEIGTLEGDVRARQSRVRERLRELYRWGRPNYLRILLSAEDPADFRKRRYLVAGWVREDRETIGSYQKRVVDLSEHQRRLEDDRRARARIVSELSAREKSLNIERQDRSQLLALVRDQQDFYERSIRELEQAAKDLQRLIETLRRSKDEGTSVFAGLKGRLPLPVRGTLERGFGPYWDSRLKAKVQQKGIDLRAPAGASIKAVFDGRVIYSGWFMGYGKVLIIDHGGGYFTLYAHASSLDKIVGEAVLAGETIGTVGDTGSLKGPYLYFELRYRGITQDPWPWFSAARR